MGRAQVFAIDGGRDVAFLSRIFDKLLVNFTWWVNRQDADGSNVFEGGFLGLDNIGPIDRSHLPPGYMLEQSDATGWMASYALSMAAIAVDPEPRTARPATDLVLKFLEHFALISEAIEEKGLWDEEDGFYYDQLRRPDGIGRAGQGALDGRRAAADGVRRRRRAGVRRARAAVGKRFARLLDAGTTGYRPRRRADDRRRARRRAPARRRRASSTCCGSSAPVRRGGVPLPVRAPGGLALAPRASVPTSTIDGCRATIDYEPAESTTAMFGGNSNWRGPIWFPVNYLVVDALFRYARYFGDELKLEYPTGSGEQHTLAEIGEDIRRRLISLFLVGEDGRRPCFGWVDRLQTDPHWKDNILFNEYFHGDNGAGLGASHQTGWTGIVADMIRRSGGAKIPTLGELIGLARATSRT